MTSTPTQRRLNSKRYVVLPCKKYPGTYQVADSTTRTIIASFHDSQAQEEAVDYAKKRNGKRNLSLLAVVFCWITFGIGIYIFYGHFFNALQTRNWLILGVITLWVVLALKLLIDNYK
jgi:hypothetical protein